MTRYMRSRPVTPAGTGPRDGFVVLSDAASPSAVEAFETALCTIRIGRRLGVLDTVARREGLLPYAKDHDNLVFDAPIASWIANLRIRYLRGWKDYESCVKGFNGLGLISDLVVRDLRRLCRLTPAERAVEVRRFLTSRKRIVKGQLQPLFTASEAAQLVANVSKEISDIDLAIWRVCADRTIVCSTSSNMGISLHQILRRMQGTKIAIGGKEVPLLNADEGQLIIWCPDKEADFMNPEKTAALCAIEAEVAEAHDAAYLHQPQAARSGCVGGRVKSRRILFSHQSAEQRGAAKSAGQFAKSNGRGAQMRGS